MAIPIGDSDYGKWRDYLNLETTDAQDRACLYLEGKGQQFLVHFGIENAIEKAEAIRAEWRMRMNQ